MTVEGFAFERLFSMPALEAVQSIRVQLIANPGMDVAQALTIVKGVELDVQGLDLEAGEALLALLPAECPNDGVQFYRVCIRVILLAFQPVWVRAMLLGRSRLYAALERNEQSIFRQAGILDEPADDAFLEWWDGLTGELRLIADLARLNRGRIAERLSLEYEAARLRAEDIDEVPRWIGLDDNTKGYDVLSFERIEGALTSKLIEVKSTIASPLRFRLTRNEWEQAEKAGSAYIFHVWDLHREQPVLHVRTVEQVRPHVPTDNDKGKWKDVEIPVGAV